MRYWNSIALVLTGIVFGRYAAANEIGGDNSFAITLTAIGAAFCWLMAYLAYRNGER